MNNLIEVKFKHVTFNVKFEFKGIEYEKTNHNRGFYYKNDKTIHKNFKKSQIVKTSSEYFDDIPLTK